MQRVIPLVEDCGRARESIFLVIIRYKQRVRFGLLDLQDRDVCSDISNVSAKVWLPVSRRNALSFLFCSYLFSSIRLCILDSTGIGYERSKQAVQFWFSLLGAHCIIPSCER